MSTPYFERSAILTIIGIIFLFSTAVIVTLLAPHYVDSTWTSPSSPYQVQMYEIEDPYVYISTAPSSGKDVNYVHHLKKNFTFLAFSESESVRFIATADLEPYITRYQDPELKLTSRLLLLRYPENRAQADAYRQQLQDAITDAPPIDYQIFELYDPQLEEAFAVNILGGALEDWIDEHFKIVDIERHHPYQYDAGVVYVLNPTEYRIGQLTFGEQKRWVYDREGRPIQNLEELQSASLGFRSRKDLIYLGEHIYAIEGCWYCHTDQTRTLVQDVVLNGSDSYPAPPSSANEYIYQKITFPGTRRIGPDLSRVGIKRPGRDWHKSHFWAPKTASAGSIMPAFQHFFDSDPRGTSKNTMGIPNYRFEAIYQYLMTKGTRITPPTQAWWIGKDPIKTKEIIEGERVFKSIK